MDQTTIDILDARYLIWLWLMLGAAAVYYMRYRAKRAVLLRFSDQANFKDLFPSITGGRFWLKASLVVLAIGLVVFALARPRIGFDWAEVRQKGVDIVIAVDVSQSMLAADIQPSRLERAKRKISDLLGMLDGDRVGLLAFAGVGFVQCPLTTDYAAVKMFLDYIDPDLIPVPGTALTDAIELATKSLAQGSPDSSAGRALIIITDGEDQDSSPVEAAKKAKEKGIKIFTIGIGQTDGAPIPEVSGGFKKDKNGNLVITKLNEDVLKEIALITDGTYVRSVSGDMDLEKIYRESLKGKTEEHEFESTRQKLWHERYQWFVFAALLLLLVEFFSLDFRRAKRA